jgi:ABC-type multidrug transport system fused ATPase/permease subunit
MSERSSASRPQYVRWLGWRVVSLFSKHARSVAALAALILVCTALDVVVPYLTRSVIDNILNSLHSAKDAALRSLFLAGSAILIATLVNRVLRSFYNYKLVRTAAECEDEIKNAAFGNFLRLDTAYHGSVNTGEIVGALDRGGTAVFVILNEVLGQNLVPPALVTLGVLSCLFLKNFWIGVLVCLPLPAYVLTISRLSQKMHSIERNMSNAFEDVTKESYDIASNVRVVKKFAREQQETGTQRSLLHTARRHHFRSERLWAVVENAQTLIATIGRVSVILLGGYFVLSQRCTVGDYVLFIAMQDMVYGPISQLSVILPKLRRNLSRAEKMFSILDARPKLLEIEQPARLRDTRHSVEFRDVSFQYPESHEWALRDLNFHVPAGATVALIGPSGSGKSTVMNLLQRLYDPQHGTVLIDGINVRDLGTTELRRRIAVVPQEVELFSRPILQNIAYGRDYIVLDEVERAARLAQAHDFITRCDNGYESQVGERGLRLSGGERQRIGIARAAMSDAGILILDEATSHLDNESERLIQLALDKVIKGRTCFIIAHRLSTVRNADLVLVFREGRIEASGRHESLWRQSPTYRALYAHHLGDRRNRPAVNDMEERAG